MDVREKYKYTLKAAKLMLLVTVLLAAMTYYMDSEKEKEKAKQTEALKIAQKLQEQVQMKEEKEALENKLARQQQEEELKRQNEENSANENEQYQEYENQETYQPEGEIYYQQEETYDNNSEAGPDEQINNLKAEAENEIQYNNYARAVEIYSQIYEQTKDKQDLILLAEYSMSANMKKPLKGYLKEYLRENPQDYKEFAKYVRFTKSQ